MPRFRASRGRFRPEAPSGPAQVRGLDPPASLHAVRASPEAFSSTTGPWGCVDRTCRGPPSPKLSHERSGPARAGRRVGERGVAGQTDHEPDCEPQGGRAGSGSRGLRQRLPRVCPSGTHADDRGGRSGRRVSRGGRCLRLANRRSTARRLAAQRSCDVQPAVSGGEEAGEASAGMPPCPFRPRAVHRSTVDGSDPPGRLSWSQSP